MIETHIKISGLFFLALSFIHVFFPRYFKWQTELANISQINRQMMYVHCFFIGLILFLLGLLCISSSSEIVSTILGKRISVGLSIFWIARLLIQFFGYSKELWVSKKKETIINITFILIWSYISSVFTINSVTS
jgi:hypothetical protein